MDIKYPKLSRSATACHKKPSSEQGITPFPLPSKEFLCLYQVSFSLFFTPTRKEPCLVIHCMSFTPSLLCYCAENLSGQPQRQDYHLTLEGVCSSASRTPVLLSGRGKKRKRKANTNNTVQTISISSLVAGRKWLVVSNLAKERAVKQSPDSILLLPFLPASLKRA